MHVHHNGVGAFAQRAGGQFALHRREWIVQRIHEDPAHHIDHQHAAARRLIEIGAAPGVPLG